MADQTLQPSTNSNKLIKTNNIAKQKSARRPRGIPFLSPTDDNVVVSPSTKVIVLKARGGGGGSLKKSLEGEFAVAKLENKENK